MPCRKSVFQKALLQKHILKGFTFCQKMLPGDPVYPYLGMDEDIIDVDITPNRGDMLSMRGVAYEVGAIYDRKVTLNHPEVKEASDEKLKTMFQLRLRKSLLLHI